MKTQDISIVIITRNRPEKLRRAVTSARITLPSAEIVVVDNDSNPAAKTRVRSVRDSAQNVELIELPKNLGVAGGRNAGIKAARGELIVLLDDDAWIEKLPIDAIRQYFHDHQKTTVIAPRIVYPNGALQESIRSFPTLPALFWRGSHLYKLFPNASWYARYTSHDATAAHEVDWAIGACQIIRRSAIETVGAFDEGYFFGYEDADFCWRVKRAGLQTTYWPDATIVHEYARTSSHGINGALFRHLLSIGRFFYKRLKAGQ